MLVDLLKSIQALEITNLRNFHFCFFIFSIGLLSVEKEPEKLTPKGQSRLAWIWLMQTAPVQTMPSPLYCSRTYGQTLVCCPAGEQLKGYDQAMILKQ